MSTSPAPGTFSLFPSPGSSRPPPVVRGQTPRGRRSGSRERRARTPSEDPAGRAHWIDDTAPGASPPRHAANGRQTPQHRRTHTPLGIVDQPPAPIQETYYPEPTAPSLTIQTQTQPVSQSQPHPQPQVQPQSQYLPQSQVHVQQHVQVQPQHLPQSQAQPLARAPSRSSIAKPPLEDESANADGQLRSIFPTYNPDLPLHQQHYAPTQMSPTGVPRAIVSRQSYHQDEDLYNHHGGQNPHQHVRSPVRSPGADESRFGAYPRQTLPQQPPAVPQVCTTEQLRSFWKVANGWKASSSEGRVYCLGLTQEKDAPVYTLSSTTQPFYHVRLDPTSASAYVTVKRHDPSKPLREGKPDGGSSSSSLLSVVGGSSSSSSPTGSGKVTDGKHWQEALSTTLEEEARRHQPNDGLVALLMPTPATKVALERAGDASAVMMAERECARLVWDDDSGSHFLVHPALATPFCVTIERSPAWSRVEYTLEHHESPKHLAKLTRDATGGGWLELDTGLASKIESFYIVDVAVTALMLVASADEKNQPAPIEGFAAPPVIAAPPQAVLLSSSGSGVGSVLGKALGGSKKKPQMEAFEIDLESQDESMGKGKKSKQTKVKEGIDKLPFVLRVPAKLARWAFKAFIWVLTMVFGCFKSMFCCCYSCVGSKY